MVVGPIVSQLKNLITPLRDGQIRHFSTENSNSTEQSTKWDKLEGKLSSDLVILDQLRNIKPLSKEILFASSIDQNSVTELIRFIFNPLNPKFGERFEQEWFHIPTEEKSNLFLKLMTPILGTNIIVGAKGCS